MATVTIGERYTPEEYLALERKSEIRHEFFKGQGRAALQHMAGHGREHHHREERHDDHGKLRLQQAGHGVKPGRIHAHRIGLFQEGH